MPKLHGATQEVKLGTKLLYPKIVRKLQFFIEKAAVATIHSHAAVLKKEAKRGFKKGCPIRNERC